MISHLRGKLTYKSSSEAVIECGGVGYLAGISAGTSEQLPALGEQALLLTLMAVREDAIQLFGFASESERDVFKQLTSISGIGGKMALGILSVISLAELQEVIIRNDTSALQKLPNVGKKTAERIIVELRDKIGKIAVQSPEGSFSTATQADVRNETLAALVALGYPRQVAEKAIRQMLAQEPQTVFTVEQLIRKTLRSIAK